MHKHIPIRRPVSARLSLRAGVFALPVLVVAALAHRGGLIRSEELFAAMALGFALALVAVVCGVGAIVSLWEKGGVGWAKAFRGVIYGLLALVPAGIAVAGIVMYPKLNDISTDPEDRPVILGRAFSPLPAEEREAQAAAYPDLLPRRFRVTPGELYSAARQVVEQRRWKVIDDDAPGLPDDPSRIQVEVRSLVFGFVDDFVVRIRPDPFGARLDLRSASRIGEHDLGANANRIRAFRDDLDAALLEAYGVLEPVAEDEEAPPPPEEGEDLPLISEVPFIPTDEAPLPSAKPDTEILSPPNDVPDDLPADLQEIYQDEPQDGPAPQ